ncbi:helix-turn-helix domain-containing protein [Thermococcus sp. M39]|uniref:excisionase family DNA-binding protein n=1 Tax=Thermococcus sp. M39 TaxID=1638262 RepID=UPI0014395995|nr:helix-turn-helix domain-containing protein [Thermococcus sp. M39]NJE08564.1 helix-turn-helix domain-containing protein [Thermococcus sp. M39]
MRRTYYTATQLAKLLRVEYSTIKKAIEKGQIKAYRYAGGWYRIPEEEVQRLLHQYGIDPNKEYLRPSQLAAMLNVASDTVVYWIHTGKLHAVKTLSGYYLIPKSEVEKLLNQNKAGS